MELIDAIGLIVFVSIGILVPVGAAYRYYQQKKIHWWILAKNNGLKYTRSRWFKAQGDFVWGDFQGYHLKLETTGVRIGDEEGYTHISLSATQSRLIIPKLKTFESRDIVATRLKVFEISQNLLGQIQGGEDPIIVSYKQDGIETNVKYLQSVINLLSDIAKAYSLALSLEGKVGSYLVNIVLNQKGYLNSVIIQLLDDILQIITSQLERKKTRLFCQNCLTNYDIHKIVLSWHKTVSYYCCRTCEESWNYCEVSKVVALLDDEWSMGKIQENGLLLINWSVQRRIFDFDEIIIVKATDEDVERFAVQIGNDTDTIRKPKYKEIKCTISPNCKLSENALRVLRRMIGQIEINEIDQSKIKLI